MSTDKSNPLKRYTFQSFDAPQTSGTKKNFMAHLSSEPLDPQQAAQQEIKFTVADMEKSRNEGYEKGFQEGTKTANEQHLKQTAEMERKLAELITGIFLEIKKTDSDILKNTQDKVAQVTRLTTAIAKKVAGDALKQDPSGKIEEVVKKCTELFGATKIQISVLVNPSMAAKVNEKIHAVAQQKNLSGNIDVKEDPTLPETGCRIEWKDGSMEIQLDAIWQEIEKIIQNI